VQCCLRMSLNIHKFPNTAVCCNSSCCWSTFSRQLKTTSQTWRTLFPNRQGISLWILPRFKHQITERKWKTFITCSFFYFWSVFWWVEFCFHLCFSKWNLVNIFVFSLRLQLSVCRHRYKTKVRRILNQEENRMNFSGLFVWMKNNTVSPP